MIGQKLDCANECYSFGACTHRVHFSRAPLSIHLFNHDSLRNDGHWKLNVASEQVDYHCEIANDHCDPQIGWRRSEMKNIVAKRKPTSFILLDRTVIDFSLSLSFFFLNDKSKSDTLKMYFFFLLNFY